VDYDQTDASASDDQENKSDSYYNAWSKLQSPNPFSALHQTQDTSDSNDKAVKVLRSNHNKWGHVGLRAVKETIKRDQKDLGIGPRLMTEIMGLTKHDVDCDACLMAKSRRNHPKPKKTRRKKKQTSEGSKTKRAETHQMSSDTFGKNPKATRTGNQYGHVTVFDDEAYSEVLFSRSKSGAATTFRDHYRMWRRQSSSKLLYLKTDRGGEWNSKGFNNWLKRRGVQRRFTSPNSSSGSAEKKIDTLQTMAMAMRNWAQLPEDSGLWESSISYANTVTLFVPSSAERLQGLSPWEKRHKTKPRMHALHSWGCLAYANVDKKKRRRYMNRARRAMFVGLPENQDDGYRFYDPKTKTFFHSRSATFRDDLPYYAWAKHEKVKLKRAISQDKVLTPMNTVKKYSLWILNIHYGYLISIAIFSEFI
jgi:hypothetical protein